MQELIAAEGGALDTVQLMSFEVGDEARWLQEEGFPAAALLQSMARTQPAAAERSRLSDVHVLDNLQVQERLVPSGTASGQLVLDTRQNWFQLLHAGGRIDLPPLATSGYEVAALARDKLPCLARREYVSPRDPQLLVHGPDQCLHLLHVNSGVMYRLPPELLRHEAGPFLATAVSGNGRLVLAVKPSANMLGAVLSLYDSQSRQVVHKRIEVGMSMPLQAFITDGGLVVLDTKEGAALHSFDESVLQPPAIDAQPGERVTVSPDGRYLVQQRSDLRVLFTDLSSGHRRELSGLGAPMSGIAFSAFNARVAAVDEEGQCIVASMLGDSPCLEKIAEHGLDTRTRPDIEFRGLDRVEVTSLEKGVPHGSLWVQSIEL